MHCSEFKKKGGNVHLKSNRITQSSLTLLFPSEQKIPRVRAQRPRRPQAALWRSLVRNRILNYWSNTLDLKKIRRGANLVSHYFILSGIYQIHLLFYIVGVRVKFSFAKSPSSTDSFRVKLCRYSSGQFHSVWLFLKSIAIKNRPSRKERSCVNCFCPKE